MMAASYMTKKQLKESIGQPLRHVETSVFGNEYRPNGKFPVVGPDPYRRKGVKTSQGIYGCLVLCLLAQFCWQSC